MQDLEELKKNIDIIPFSDLGDIAKNLIARCESAEKNQVVDVTQLIHEYEAASEVEGWEHPHPIFKMAQEIDLLHAELKELREQKPAIYFDGRKVLFNPEYEGLPSPNGEYYAWPVAQSRDSAEPVDEALIRCGSCGFDMGTLSELSEAFPPQSNANAHSEQAQQTPFAYRIVNHKGVESVHKLTNPEKYKRDYPDFIVEPLYFHAQQSPAVAVPVEIEVTPDKHAHIVSPWHTGLPRGRHIIHVCISAAPQASAEPDSNLTEAMEIVKCVAHIGVDFGFGEYHIEQSTIDKARKLVAQDEGKV